MRLFAALLAAYLLGGIPFGYLLVRWRRGEDVRALGSGNIGATNVLRTTGRALGLLTLFLDMLKGWLAVFLAARLTGGPPLWTALAALTVVLGHIFPAFLRFRGGKAVASFVGAFAYLAPVPLAATAVVFFVVVWATRFVSLGSIIGAACFPFGVFLIDHPPAPILLSALLCGALVVWRHAGNWRRLREGTEHTLNLGRSRR